MTNRERARAWLLDTYPSAWEAEHVDALTSLLNDVVQHERARIVAELMVARRGRGAGRASGLAATTLSRAEKAEAERDEARHTLEWTRGVVVEERETADDLRARLARAVELLDRAWEDHECPRCEDIRGFLEAERAAGGK